LIYKFREPVSGLIHLVSAGVAAAGLVLLLIVSRGDALKQLSVGIYGFSLVLLFSASAIYHLVPGGEDATRRLRKFDHAAIYMLIAGTYTPICLNFFSGWLQWGFLALIWAMALAGVVVKLFVINAPRWVTARDLPRLWGWMAVLVIKPMLAVVPAGGLLWMLAGGVLYTVGAVIYITKKMDLYPGVFGFHEVWHVFVTLAALCHFIMIYQYVAMG